MVTRIVFSVVNAGHPNPFYVNSNYKIKKLSTHGPILGISPESVYKKTDFEAEDGQIFLFYTDGLMESCHPEDKILSPNDLSQFLALYSQNQPDFSTLHDQIILHKLVDETQAALVDDISILVMRVEKKK